MRIPLTIQASDPTKKGFCVSGGHTYKACYSTPISIFMWVFLLPDQSVFKITKLVSVEGGDRIKLWQVARAGGFWLPFVEKTVPKFTTRCYCVASGNGARLLAETFLYNLPFLCMCSQQIDQKPILARSTKITWLRKNSKTTSGKCWYWSILCYTFY